VARLLVDGYNVIRRDPILRELERQDPLASRAELLRLLHHSSLRGYTVTVVFDGVAPAGDRPWAGGVRVIHSREQTADALIAHLCGPRDVVVTDDRTLAADTLPAGPRIWSVAKLLEMVRPRGRGRPGVQPAEEQARTPSYPRLRRFDACRRCLFSGRDDWIMLCEEDSELGRPRNFRERW
jgi:hypothetical protein